MPKDAKKSPAQQLEDKLVYKRNNAWEYFSSAADQKKIFALAEIYKQFLSSSKTERMCVHNGQEQLKKAGFSPVSSLKKMQQGTKAFFSAHHKNLAAFVLGKKPLTDGLTIIAAHIDSPRIDLKPQPLYEDEGIALLKTRYYGGIKKYQWPTLPLSLHGVIVTQTGKIIEISLGEKETDPVFMFTDLLPHLAQKQMAKKLREGIEGEDLNLVLGNIPINDKKIKEKVKLAILKHLYTQYQITEEDFISAELEIVPAGHARDLGFDRSLVAGYGQDDRSCAYLALQALINTTQSDTTAVLIWIDKEEIGSDGITSAQSIFLEQALGALLEKNGLYPDQVTLRKIFERSYALSADVDTVLDPTFKSVSELRNTARLGYGVILTKYTGHGGKYHASEANAEYLAKLRRLFNTQKIPWQTGELGKVDEGGGGTIAKYIANRGINIADCGVGLLNIHAPWEISSKVDLYCTYVAYKAFWEKIK